MFKEETQENITMEILQETALQQLKIKTCFPLPDKKFRNVISLYNFLIQQILDDINLMNNH